jgi:hypothetical protein
LHGTVLHARPVERYAVAMERRAVLVLMPASASAFHTTGARACAPGRQRRPRSEHSLLPLDRFDNVGLRRRYRAQNSLADKWRQRIA